MVDEIRGYRRADGRLGLRNHVVVLPVDDLSNAAAEKAAAMVPGVVALPHAYGRLQFGEDLDLTFRTLTGTGANPNVAAAVVIGIEPKWTDRVAEGIAAKGKPVETFSVERSGDLAIAEKAGRVLQPMLQDASEAVREPAGLGELSVGLKDGESDTTIGLGANPATAVAIGPILEAGGTAIFGETSELTGGEHLIVERCVDDEVRKRFLSMYEDYVAMIQGSGADLLGSQPTEGNIRGGLSTIEEKALGTITKMGTYPVVEALGPAEAPSKPGLSFMDTSSAAAECVTLMAAAGCTIYIFPTGQGNIVGNPIVPVIKVTANPLTARTMAEHIDIELSGLLRQEYDLQEAGRRLLELTVRTANGRLTAAESLGHREFVITKLYRSA